MAKKRRASPRPPAKRKPGPGGRAPARPAARGPAGSRGRTIVAASIVAIVIAGFVAPLLLRDNGAESGGAAASSTTTTRPVSIAGLETFELPKVSHRTGPITYAQSPPVGGDHDPVWLNCGSYAAPVRNENAVHSMEHGAVWITYRPDLPPDQVTVLKNIAQRTAYIVLSPYPGLPAPVVASAWGRQVKLESVNDTRLSPFLDQFRSGSQAPERGAPCEGGTGTPE